MGFWLVLWLFIELGACGYFYFSHHEGNPFVILAFSFLYAEVFVLLLACSCVLIFFTSNLTEVGWWVFCGAVSLFLCLSYFLCFVFHLYDFVLGFDCLLFLFLLPALLNQFDPVSLLRILSVSFFFCLFTLFYGYFFLFSLSLFYYANETFLLPDQWLPGLPSVGVKANDNWMTLWDVSYLMYSSVVLNLVMVLLFAYLLLNEKAHPGYQDYLWSRQGEPWALFVRSFFCLAGFTLLFCAYLGFIGFLFFFGIFVRVFFVYTCVLLFYLLGRLCIHFFFHPTSDYLGVVCVSLFLVSLYGGFLFMIWMFFLSFASNPVLWFISSSYVLSVLWSVLLFEGFSDNFDPPEENENTDESEDESNE